MTQLLENAAYGAALILAAALLRRLLKERLVPEVRLALWAVCLFRLLTPVSPESVWSLWGLVGRMGTEAPSAPVQNLDPLPLPSGTLGDVPAAQFPVTGAANPVQPVTPAAFPWEMVAPAVWIGVGLALAVWYVRSWLRTRRAVECAIPVVQGDPRYLFLPRFARLREGVMEGAPLTFGAARPTVVLSPGLSGEELACVLAHEAVHARRRDNLWHYVMALALVVHWWNPAVWLMSRLLRRDIELACDKAAVKKLGSDRRADYARALVSMATQAEGPAFCQTFGRKAAEERILSIMKWKKTSVLGIVLSLALVAGVTVAFASAPKAPAGEQDGSPNNDTPYEVCTNPLCTVDYQHCHIDGKVVRAYEQNPGLLCAHPDCDIEGPHAHDGVQYAGQAGEFVILNSDTAPVPSGAPDGLNGFAVQMDGSVVTRVIVSLDVLEEDLGIRVDEGSMPKAEAELIFSQAQSIAVDGVIDWTFAQDNGLRHEELSGESDDTTTVSANGYWDQDGKFVPVNISQIVSKFILPQALMGEDTGTVYNPDDFTVVEPEIDGQGNSIVRDENGDIVMVGIRTACGMESLCEEPGCQVTEAHCHDRDGKVVQVHYQMPGQLCTRADCTASGVHEHEGVSYQACTANLTPEQYADALDAWVALGGVTQAEADGWLEIFQTCYDHVQAGDSDAFYYNIYNGTKWASAFYKSDRVASGYPVNSRGETYGPDMPEVYGSSPDLILAEGTKGETGYVRASDLDCNYPGGVNNPEEALAYMEWLKTQPATRYVPLYDSEGNVIGQFGVSNPVAEGELCSLPTAPTTECGLEGCNETRLHQHQGERCILVDPVCTVTGCTAEGYHTHDGVGYCDGAAQHSQNRHRNGHH